MPVIGEGGYGCVHLPSLKCSEKGIDYTDKVSKLMLLPHAKLELSEHSQIDKMDGTHRFSFPSPVLCTLEKSTENLSEVNKCISKKYFVNENGTWNNKDKALLIMENGGTSLFDLYGWFMDSRVNWNEKVKMAEKFWKQTPILFEALQVLQENRMCHHDVKVANIVFNKTTGRIALIDFGDMRPFSAVMTEPPPRIPIVTVPVEGALYTPVATGLKLLYNSHSFEKEIPHYTMKVWSDDFVQEILTSNVSPPELTNSEMLKQLETEFQNFRELYAQKPFTYSEFKKKSVATYDLYGVGMALLSMCNATRDFDGKIKMAPIELVLRQCMTPNVMARLSVDEAVKAYSKALGVKAMPRKTTSRGSKTGSKTRSSSSGSNSSPGSKTRASSPGSDQAGYIAKLKSKIASLLKRLKMR